MAASPVRPTQPRSRRRCSSTTPVLDERVNAGWPAFEAALKANGVQYEMYMYPGTNHGFHNDTTPRYDEDAAKLAWLRTISFLNAQPRGPEPVAHGRAPAGDAPPVAPAALPARRYRPGGARSGPCGARQSMAWNPEQYLKFGGERLRPAQDLLARVSLEAPRDIVDLGCGTGTVTALLRARWPQARIVGVDNSQAMLERARATLPEVVWEQR